ncbi:DUF4282 domain-containing protein [Nesterenkonia sp. F]|uniref:DUF4282 domain-containing protein n=1 Tax=Nesterenkonia sp. F TaxID=795955 RepID=UPI000255D0A2|nr:DUF4282 domain-containing protein [Nesterenkonia sp. F]
MTQPPGAPGPSGQQPPEGQHPQQGYYPQQGRQPSPQDQPPHPQQSNAVEAKGFFGALFDFSFQSFVTVKFATFIYIVLLVFLVLGWLFMVIGGFVADTWVGVLALLLGWIPAVIYLILIRVMLEFYIAMIRTSQNTAGTRIEIESLRREMHQRR